MREPTPTDDHGGEVHGGIIVLRSLVVQREAAARVSETTTTSSDPHLDWKWKRVNLDASHLNCSPLNGNGERLVVYGFLSSWQPLEAGVPTEITKLVEEVRA